MKLKKAGIKRETDPEFPNGGAEAAAVIYACRQVVSDHGALWKPTKKSLGVGKVDAARILERLAWRRDALLQALRFWPWALDVLPMTAAVGRAASVGWRPLRMLDGLVLRRGKADWSFPAGGRRWAYRWYDSDADGSAVLELLSSDGSSVRVRFEAREDAIVTRCKTIFKRLVQ